MRTPCTSAVQHDTQYNVATCNHTVFLSNHTHQFHYFLYSSCVHVCVCCVCVISIVRPFTAIYYVCSYILCACMCMHVCVCACVHVCVHVSCIIYTIYIIMPYRCVTYCVCVCVFVCLCLCVCNIWQHATLILYLSLCWSQLTGYTAPKEPVVRIQGTYHHGTPFTFERVYNTRNVV